MTLGGLSMVARGGRPRWSREVGVALTALEELRVRDYQVA